MKKLNIQVYQGNPEEMVTRDNNNLFIDGEIEYNAGGGTVVKSITSVKNSEGTEIVSGGGGDEFPYEYVCPDDFSVTIQPEDWEISGEEANCHINIEPIALPENCETYFYYVNENCGNQDNSAYIVLGNDKHQLYLEIYFLMLSGNFNGFGIIATGDITLIESEFPYTFDFSKIVFIGEKKTDENQDNEVL